MVSRRRSREDSLSREASLRIKANRRMEAADTTASRVPTASRAPRGMDSRAPTASRAPRGILSRTRSRLAPAATVLHSSPTRTTRPPRPRLRDGRGSDPAAGRLNLINGVVRAKLTEASAG